jgi:hypothetical protein
MVIYVVVIKSFDQLQDHKYIFKMVKLKLNFIF